MKVERVEPASGPVVTHIGPGSFRTREARFDGGLILLPDRAVAWDAAPVSADQLTLAALADVRALAPKPEFVILGTGAAMAFPPPDLRAALDADGIGLEVMDSRTAARAWSLLRAEDRWIAAALLPLR